ncbi:MAG TPA: hypothetical protein VG651_11860 [Stellaceae bacterium]|nr:hypothetical protein [Stellaceae bacterium]
MFGTRPHALIVEPDEQGRARMAALLRDSGFVVAAFRAERGALAALAARPADMAVIAGELAEGEDALATACRLRRCRPETKLLFCGAAAALPASPGPGSGHAVTRPFDKRRFLSAVFELLARGDRATERRDEAELGLMAARLACLRSRLPGFESLTEIQSATALATAALGAERRSETA